MNRKLLRKYFTLDGEQYAVRQVTEENLFPDTEQKDDISYTTPSFHGNRFIIFQIEEERAFLEVCGEIKSYYDDIHEDYLQNYAEPLPNYDEENPTC